MSSGVREGYGDSGMSDTTSLRIESITKSQKTIDKLRYEDRNSISNEKMSQKHTGNKSTHLLNHFCKYFKTNFLVNQRTGKEVAHI